MVAWPRATATRPSSLVFLEFLFLVSFEEFCPRTKFEFHYIEAGDKDTEGELRCCSESGSNKTKC